DIDDPCSDDIAVRLVAHLYDLVASACGERFAGYPHFHADIARQNRDIRTPAHEQRLDRPASAHEPPAAQPATARLAPHQRRVRDRLCGRNEVAALERN